MFVLWGAIRASGDANLCGFPPLESSLPIAPKTAKRGELVALFAVIAAMRRRGRFAQFTLLA